jgi:HlyD family secretion protein
MDIVRMKRRWSWRYFGLGVGSAVLVALAAGASRLEKRPPSVDRTTAWIDTVRRGTMLRQVHAPGTLVPEHVRIISAATGGRVELLPIKPGVVVTPTTVLAQLSNPDVQLQALTAERDLAAAEGALALLEQTLTTQRLNLQAAASTAEMTAKDAARTAAVFDSLDKKGLAGANELAKAHDAASDATTKLRIARDQLRELDASIDQQIALQKSEIDHIAAIMRFNQGRIESMRVTAGDSGILQELPMELGQWVTAGSIIARISQPGKLKAVLRVPETDAKDVAIGQVVSIDTRNGLIAGHVQRIDPAVENGTVGVDVSLDGQLPAGARADLSVDGTIEIERLTDVLYVGRPAFAQPQATGSLFRLAPDGITATRQTVQFGRTSVTTIEVVRGLAAGDRVIISDMSTFENANKVRVE